MLNQTYLLMRKICAVRMNVYFSKTVTYLQWRRPFIFDCCQIQYVVAKLTQRGQIIFKVAQTMDAQWRPKSNKSEENMADKEAPSVTKSWNRYIVTKVLFNDRYTSQNFGLWILCLLTRHKICKRKFCHV